MRNRDYFYRPVQSDRLSLGYGHTTLQPARGEHWTVSLALWVSGGLAVYAIVVML